MAGEFVINQSERYAVEKSRNDIQELFNVQISFANGTVGKVWITLTGEGLENKKRAKSYVQALASPDETQIVDIPASLIRTFGPRTNEHFKLESEYGVVITFPESGKATIAGSSLDVTLAASKLEGLIASTSQAKVPQSKPDLRTSQPKSNRALEDFALKLGYEQKQINMVFDKLGYPIDKNTFLNELINVSGARSRATVDDRPPTCRIDPAELSRRNGLGTGSYNPANGLNSYGVGTGVLSRGVNPRGTTPSNVPSPNQRYIYNRDLGLLGASTDSLIAARGYTPRTTVSTSQGNNSTYVSSIPRSADVLSRGLIMPRNTPQSTQGINVNYPSQDWYDRDNGLYSNHGQDYNTLTSDPQQVDLMVDQFLTTYQRLPQSDLRHIVIDGSNVAMSHGNNKVFSCKGIALCVEWFRKRGHNQITVFVPTWRKESAKPDNPITDQHVLNQLEAQGFLTYTPSRKVKGRRIVCYDDRFIIRLAESTDGVIVSNDNFKDLSSESPKWREVIEQRLLMYSFVSDMFMVPDDPLGRHGPTLNEFLHMGTQTHRRVCPYGRRCTYGTRCKYHHPEREDNNRLPIYQSLQSMFPNQEALILSVMKKYPQEKNADTLASLILEH